MRTKLLIAAMFLAGLTKAQITLENNYAATAVSGIGIVELANSGYKYYGTDAVSKKKVILYNLNHSVWKTINLTLPTGYIIYGIWNISDGLFNSDAGVEVAYTCYLYNYNPPATYNHQGNIVDESGNLIKTFPNCNIMTIANTGANGWKLIATIDSVNKLSTKNTEVYSLPGGMPTTALKENKAIDPLNLSSPSPNPSQNKTTITYALPEGMSTAELSVFDLNGREIKRYTVSPAFNTLELDNTELASGTYLYQLNLPNGQVQTKKMLIIK